MKGKSKKIIVKCRELAKLIFDENNNCIAVSFVPIAKEKFEGKNYNRNYGITILRNEK